MNLGQFSTHTRHGELVTKLLDPHHPSGTSFVAAMTRTGTPGMRRYLASLHAAGVRLPRELTVLSAAPLGVRHRWVTAPTVPDLISGHPARAVAAVQEVCRWLSRLADTDARIDTNLHNLCVTEHGAVLVDVLPPLIPSLRPAPGDMFDQLFTALCFDTPVTHDALLGYTARALLRAGHRRDAARLFDTADTTPLADSDPGGFPAAWFRARLAVARRAASQLTGAADLHEFYALTSVLAFRQLDEPARRTRLQQVDRQLKEIR